MRLEDLSKALVGLLLVHGSILALPPQGGLEAGGSDRTHPDGYRGPGDVLPRGGAVGGAAGPAAPAPGRGAPSLPGAPALPSAGVPDARSLVAALDPTSWFLWWQHNRDPYLALAASLDRIHAVTGPEEGAWLAGRRAGLTQELVWGRVVPSLLAELARNEDERVTCKALLALARIGEPPSAIEDAARREPLATIVRHLASPQTAVAETAVIALGVLGSREGMIELVELARDTRRGRHLVDQRRVPLRVRALAAYGLSVAASEIGTPEVGQFAAWHLVELLEEDGHDHPDIAAACAIGMGIVPLDSERAGVFEARRSPSGSREAATEWLLEGFLDRRSPGMLRAHAPVAMARQVAGFEGGLRARVMSALIDALDPDARATNEVRTGCIMALGRLADGDKDPLDSLARERLMRSAEGSNANERNFALVALAQAASRAGTGAGDARAGEREVRAHLLAEVEDGRSRLRPWAGLALGLLGNGLRAREEAVPPGVAEALAERLRDTRSPEDAAAYAVGAGLLGEPLARAAIESGLEQFRDEHWRASMAAALGLLGDPAALPALRRVMADGHWRPELVEQAAIARALLGDRTLVAELGTRLAGSPRGTDALGVIRALAWTGDGRSLPALLTYLSQSERVDAERALAIEAIGWIADKERVVWDARISAGLNYVAAPQTLTDPWGLGILDTL